MRKFGLGLHLIEVLEEYGIKAMTKEDEETIEDLLKSEIPFSIDEYGRVWDEGGTYVADVTDDEKQIQIRLLLDLGWEEVYKRDDEDFHLTRVFEINDTKELSDFVDEINENKKYYCRYNIYFNQEKIESAVWDDTMNPGNAEFNDFESVNYESIIEEAMEEKLFTYPHWLEIIFEENNTNAYQVAKKGNGDKTTLYRLISNNTSFNNIQLSTIDMLARGLELSHIEFIDKYFDRFFDKEDVE